MNILIVSSDFPYPPDHGARVDILKRIQALATRINANVDLIATIKEPVDQKNLDVVERYARQIYLVKRTANVKDFLSFWPYQVTSRRGLSDVVLTSFYDHVFLEGDYVASILDNPSLKYKKIYLRVHNNESVFFMQLAKAARNWKSIYYSIESKKFHFFQKKIRRRVDGLVFISKDEFEQYQGNKESCWVPPYADLRNFKSRSLGGANVLYVSSLFMPNNVWGLRWYLDHVHQQLVDRNASYRLIVAGNSRGGDISWLTKYEHIEICDTPSDTDLEALYHRSCLFVAPVFHGAGVKIKVINAICEGLPVVTTETGNEGTGLKNHKHVIECQDSSGFIEAVDDCLKNPAQRASMVKSAQKFLRGNYNYKYLLEKILV